MEFADEEKPLLCRLCFSLCEKDFKMIDDTTKEMLAVLLKSERSLPGEPICKNCLKNIDKCFTFKSLCLYTENCIKSLSRNENAKLNIRDIFLKITGNENKGAIPEGYSVCRLCMELVKYNYCVPDDGTEDMLSMWKTFNQYIPEIDLKLTSDLTICKTCYIALQDYINLIGVQSYSENEEETLPKVKTALSRDKTGLGIRRVSPIYTIKRENDFNDLNTDTMFVESGHNEEMFKCEDLLEASDQELNIKHEDVEIKTSPLDPGRSPDCTLHVNNYCVTNFSPTETKPYGTIHQCDSCPFKTIYKGSLNNHILKHKDFADVPTYSCDFCEYKSKRKQNLKDHKIVHMDSSTMALFKCELCKFETKHHSALRRHAIVHEIVPTVGLYECKICDYRTNRKDNLKAHAQRKHKCALKRHNVRHQSSLEITIYHCEVCEYKTMQKGALNRHAVVHQKESELIMYQCNDCSYKTKHKRALKVHVRIHQNPADTAIFQCDTCEFKTKYSHVLKYHVLTHQSVSEMTMYQCELCQFKTKHKRSLKSHSLVHQGMLPHAATMHHCELCEYETRHKYYLKRHMLLHRDTTEVTMYKCCSCEYETKYKHQLKAHEIIHRDASDVEIFKCERCEYETRHKRGLKRHMRLHDKG